MAVTTVYEMHGTHVTPAALIAGVAAALREVVRIGEPPAVRANVTDEEREVLRAGGFALGRGNHAGIDAYQRTQIKLATIIANAYTTLEAAADLGVTASRVRQMLGARELYGIKWQKGWRVPRFQFDGDHLVPYVGRVLSQLDPALNVIAIFNWFTLPNDDLRDEGYREMSPRAWLIAGRDWERVADQAAAI